MEITMKPIKCIERYTFGEDCYGVLSHRLNTEDSCYTVYHCPPWPCLGAIAAWALALSVQLCGPRSRYTPRVTR